MFSDVYKKGSGPVLTGPPGSLPQIRMSDLPPSRRGPHIAVAQARVVALMGGVFGFSLTVFGVILQGLVPAIALAIVSVLAFSLIAQRLRRGAGMWGAQPSAWAQVPTYAAATAFLVYGFAIGAVHLHVTVAREGVWQSGAQ